VDRVVKEDGESVESPVGCDEKSGKSDHEENELGGTKGDEEEEEGGVTDKSPVKQKKIKKNEKTGKC